MLIIFFIMIIIFYLPIEIIFFIKVLVDNAYQTYDFPFSAL